ncbi:MAG: hypothetical protein ACK5KP_02080 [Paludibacteraceae bacterium]
MKKVNLTVFLCVFFTLMAHAQKENKILTDTLPYLPKVVTTSTARTMNVEETLFPGNVIVDGDLGIGFSSPSERLHLNGNIRGNGLG